MLIHPKIKWRPFLQTVYFFFKQILPRIMLGAKFDHEGKLSKPPPTFLASLWIYQPDYKGVSNSRQSADLETDKSDKFLRHINFFFGLCFNGHGDGRLSHINIVWIQKSIQNKISMQIKKNIQVINETIKVFPHIFTS